jgi:hypothetical protein
VKNNAFPVNGSLTGKAPIENAEYAAAVRRMVNALGRRVASGDIAGLPLLAELDAQMENLMRETIASLRTEHGYSWFEIGRELGLSRQGAQQRFGSRA